MQKTTDFLVIGSGITGLIYALKAANHGSVFLISKTGLPESTTSYAQGGIAAVMYPPDSIEKHVNDTIECGRGLCNQKMVKLIISESTNRIQELIKLGTQFDTKKDGKYDLGKEGGHSENRVLHHKDNTGKEIIRALEKKVKEHPNIKILENYFAIELITQHHQGQVITRHFPGIKCFGAYVLNTNDISVETILAKKTLMATGGAGMAYNTTTNPPIATGDGIAMVHRAKGIIDNMEFVQFHPTSLYNPGERPSFLITEAIRGFGAVLKDFHGNEFMHKYDKRQSLAPRDIVARAIDHEMKLSGEDHVYLDCSHLNHKELISHFPNIHKKCLSIGIDIRKDMIPVVPAAHYMCGGIKTDEHGRSSILNLYAAGECASTGMHGSNRMASNSLLEALVMASRAAEHAISELPKTEIARNIPDWDSEGTVLNEEMILITQSLREVQSIMSNYVGIVRSDLRLKRAFNRLNLIFRETEDLYIKSILSPKLCELRNIISVAYLIIKQAMNRHSSVGLHYTLDYPEQEK